MRRFLLCLVAVLAMLNHERVSIAQQPAKRIKLFDGVSLKGWKGNPAFWSVKDGAIHGVTNETRGELLLTDGDYADFRLILKSRLVSDAPDQSVCQAPGCLPGWRQLCAINITSARSSAHVDVSDRRCDLGRSCGRRRRDLPSISPIIRAGPGGEQTSPPGQVLWVSTSWSLTRASDSRP